MDRPLLRTVLQKYHHMPSFAKPAALSSFHPEQIASPASSVYSKVNSAQAAVRL